MRCWYAHGVSDGLPSRPKLMAEVPLSRRPLHHTSVVPMQASIEYEVHLPDSTPVSTSLIVHSTTTILTY